MRNFDFSPLYRSTVGFDQFADLLDRVFAGEVNQPTYPPFNIEKTAEDSYRISIAAAGFSPDEMNVEVRDQQLIVTARKVTEEENRTFLHRGIAERAFEKRFQLADHVQVEGATMENGMLHIDLKRVLPENLRPRKIEIAGPRVIEGEARKIETTKAKEAVK